MRRTVSIFALIILLFQAGIVSAQQYHFSSDNKKAIKYYKEAETDYRQKELAMAVESLQKAVKKDAGFIEAWLLLGDPDQRSVHGSCRLGQPRHSEAPVQPDPGSRFGRSQLPGCLR